MKTLVKQLREMVEKSREDGGFPTDFAEPFIGCRVERSEEERELFTIIANRIEREYLPRPRFEDGEPVQFGDEFIDSYGRTDNVSVISVNELGFFNVHSYKSEDATRYPKKGTVKRPAPEVLDADDVPIIVGDVVYFVDSAEAFEVLGVESDGDEPVHIGRKDRTSTDAWVSNSDLTHKQPDTLERIEADARKMFNDYWGCRDAECRCCPAMVDGKSPDERYENSGNCTTAQRLDLLHRQREVLERGQA